MSNVGCGQCYLLVAAGLVQLIPKISSPSTHNETLSAANVGGVLPPGVRYSGSVVTGVMKHLRGGWRAMNELV